MFTRRHLRPITLKISHTSSRAQSFTFFCILVVLFVTSSRSRVQTPLSNDGESRRRVENEMTFLAFLMLFFFFSSSSTGTTRAAMEETNLINDPFQSTSCRDAQMYCEQTITPAIEQDSTLKQFLRDERKEAKRTQSWESVVPEERMKQMKVPETLALGKFGVGVGVLLLCFAF